ncbi:hypothetical protein QEJ63_gp09 [Bifidobacterium phage BD811P2]|uniref:hypothetical protein n=1 Tax=Bifidobacterium phage BD811P2 TaxID=2968613 RepID=UPI0024342110|nr:hypothetical protein QEJ63_gp09 [Bifidobacterium phage BD811P2]WAX06319.1 hypothetical protein BD811P2_00009 [Bifidobacterium phage BD811P2]
MAEPDTGDKDITVPSPTEEERRTETVDDEVRPNEGSEPESKDDGPDVSARLDSIEKELAALKAMMDTLGYTDPTPSDDDEGDDDDGESIEDLFD